MQDNLDRQAITMFQTGESLTDAELRASIAQFIRAMQASGLVTGSRIAVLLGNQIEFPVILMGAQHGGFDLLPLSTHMSVEDVLGVLRDYDPHALVVADTFAKQAAVIAEHLPSRVMRLMTGVPSEGWESFGALLAQQSSQPVTPVIGGRLLLLSGGSTGRPKIVIRQNAPRSADVSAYAPFGADSVTLIPAPLHHTMPIMWLLGTLNAGGHAVILTCWDPEDTLRAIDKHKVTILPLVPTMMIRLLGLPHATRNRYDVTSLRAVAHAAAPCPPDVKQRFMNWIPRVWELYGMTERLGATLISPDEARERPGSVGRPVDCEVVIRDEDGIELSANQVGIVWFRRQDGARMYYMNEPIETLASYNKHGEGTVRDLGYVDDEGYLYLSGRLKNMIIVGGVNVYPVQIEHVLQGHPQVADVCVVGIDHADMGQIPVAVVQFADNVNDVGEALESLQALALNRLHGPMRPCRWVVVEELPRQATGKINFKQVAALAR